MAAKAAAEAEAAAAEQARALSCPGHKLLTVVSDACRTTQISAALLTVPPLGPRRRGGRRPSGRRQRLRRRGRPSRLPRPAKRVPECRPSERGRCGQHARASLPVSAHQSQHTNPSTPIQHTNASLAVLRKVLRECVVGACCPARVAQPVALERLCPTRPPGHCIKDCPRARGCVGWRVSVRACVH